MRTIRLLAAWLLLTAGSIASGEVPPRGSEAAIWETIGDIQIRGEDVPASMWRLQQWGIFTGYPDRALRADQPITRGEFVAVLARFVDRYRDLLPESRRPGPLADFEAARAAALQTHERSFWSGPLWLMAAARPDAGFLAEVDVLSAWYEHVPPGARVFLLALPRAEMAGHFCELMGAFGVNAVRSDKPMPSDVPSWHYADSVRTVLDAGLMEGYPDRKFRPNKPATRGEVALVLVRLVQVIRSRPPDPR
jgi:hypothetical protein